MTVVNISDVVVTMNEAEKRSLEDDKKRLIDLATKAQAATQAFNDLAGDVAESFKEFGLTKTGLSSYAKSKAKTGTISGEVTKLEIKIEELQFLDGE